MRLGATGQKIKDIEKAGCSHENILPFLKYLGLYAPDRQLFLLVLLHIGQAEEIQSVQHKADDSGRSNKSIPLDDTDQGRCQGPDPLTDRNEPCLSFGASPPVQQVEIGDGHCNILQIGRIDLRLVVAKLYDEQNLQSHADHQSKGTKRNLAFLFQFGRIIVLVIFEMGNNKRRITFTLR